MKKIKEKLSTERLIAIVIIALIITILTVFSLSGDLSKITGMAAAKPSGFGDSLVIYFMAFLITMTIIMVFLAEYLLKKKK
jgi:uncharacterized membrane protein